MLSSQYNGRGYVSIFSLKLRDSHCTNLYIQMLYSMYNWKKKLKWQQLTAEYILIVHKDVCKMYAECELPSPMAGKVQQWTTPIL